MAFARELIFFMNLRRLSLGIADGFTRAADAPGRTQPAISLQIKRLEELLQVQLLQRDTRELTLTSEGETVALYARQILFLNDELFCRLGSREIEGTIRIGIPNDLAVSFLPEILGSFNAAPRCPPVSNLSSLLPDKRSQ